MDKLSVNTVKKEKRVLVVDDDDGLRKLIVRCLNKSGYDVYDVSNGFAAIEFINANPDIVLLLDQQLPDMTGQEIINSLSKMGFKVPFIMMTGYGDEQLAVKIMKLGAADYLVKDIDFTDILPEVMDRVFRNIETERRLRFAEEALRKSEARYKSIMEFSNTGVWEYHQDTDFLWCSPEYFAMLGYDLSEFRIDGSSNLKDTWVNLLHPDDKENASKHFAEYLEKGSIGIYESYFRMKHKNGEWRWIWSRGQPLRDKNGELTTLTIGTHIDVTARKQAEEELIKAKEKAEKADKLKSEFLAQMSHEIRTPVGALMSYSQLLDELLKEDEYKDIFSGMQNSGKRIIRTIDMILNISEIQSGLYEYTRKKLSLIGDILEKLHSEFKYAATSKNLSLKLDYESDCEIIADEYSVTQIFANLIDNAIKYTKTGGIIISLKKNKFNYTVVEVADTGVGMSEEFQKEIFKPFSQEHHGYNRQYDGNGLGLALVKEYCKMNDLEISVKSKKGQGTTFIITFPDEF